jgi:NRAMP (natural resistance-associated macrophage protein)-like metal ion transporter
MTRRVEDPLLKRSSVGADDEPELKELLKGSADGGAGAPGGPHPGQTGLGGGRRGGPFGLLRLLGPGLITGASDDDPSGIGTYSQVGSQFGYGLLWMALFTFPLMAAVQELCGRIALQTGVGLGISLRRKFPTWLVGVCILALLAANTINLGADLGAIAAGGSLLSRGLIEPLWLVLPVALLVVALQFFVTYELIFKVFKWLTLVLFAYVVTGFLVHPQPLEVLKATFVPHIEPSRDFITAMVAVLGTTISPYLFFWQASSEVDQMRAAGLKTEAQRRGVKLTELRAARVDILIGMAFSQVVMYFIILTSGAVLHAHGKTSVQTAAQAAEALAPLAGPFAFVLFAVGLIGTGLLAVPILSGSAAYAVKEFLGLKGSLATKARYRPAFYGVIAAATAAGVVMNFMHVDPIRALFTAAVINGAVAPPLLVLIVLLGSDRGFMKNRVSGPWSKVLTWIAAGAMATATVAMLVTTVAR